jgi:antitoxin component YwqK of YwqJK toxin-antitoxin module
MSRYLYLLGFFGLFLAGCYNNKQESNVVSTRYIHKYGYAVSKDEFEERKYPGQVVTALKNGVTITSTYENGVLHGLSRHTFPDSQTIETDYLYNQGSLVKVNVYDVTGLPLREEVVLSPTRSSSTKWYSTGTPLSIEEFAGEEIVEAQYFNLQNEVEAQVQKGKGTRVLRNIQGILLSKDNIEEGYVTKRETFYPNGSPESIAFYVRGVLHGEKKSFTENGEPLAVKEYIAGKLHGKTTFFKNGARYVDIHYLDGLKNGLEIHYIDGTVVSQEIVWENDHKHGPSKYYIEGIAQVEYYYDGDLVSEAKWKELNQLDDMINKISPAVAWK